MAKELKTIKLDNEVNLDTDGEAAALKSCENIRKHVRDVMKEKEKEAKDLEKATSTDTVRLQGMKEPKPSIKPYTEGIDVKSREELAKKLSEIKSHNNTWKISRSLKEGYRYTVTEVIATRLNESKEDESEDSEDELTAIDAIKAILDIHGEDGTLIIAKKGELEDEDAIKLEIKVSKDEFEAIEKEFHEEEGEESEVEEPEETTSSETSSEEEIIEPEGDMVELDLEPVEESFNPYNDYKTGKITYADYVNVCEFENVKPQPEIKEGLGDAIKDIGNGIGGAIGGVGNAVNDIFEDEKHPHHIRRSRNHTTTRKEEGLGLLGIGDVNVNVDASGTNAAVGVGGGKGSNESLNITNNDSPGRVDNRTQTKTTSDSSSPLDVASLDNIAAKEEGLLPDLGSLPKPPLPGIGGLGEASSAEKKAFRQGGDKMNRLVTGRTISRIHNPEARKAAVAAHKAGRDDVVKALGGDRKEHGVERDIEHKFQSMANAGMTDEVQLTESAKIMLDDLKMFKPWGGAIDTWELILSNNKLEELDKALEDMYKDGINATDLNDILWFEKDFIYEKLGINPFVKAKSDDIIDADEFHLIDEPEEDK